MKGGAFRGFIATIGLATAGFFRRLKFWGRGRTYPNPILRDPYTRHRKGSRQPGKARDKRVLPCRPGDILYHDKLVRHFGRRLAEGYRIAIQRGHLNCLPSAQDFADNPPWEFLK